MLSFSLLIESLQVVQSRKVFLLFKVVLLVFGLYVWSSSVEQDTIVAIIIPDKRTIFFIVISLFGKLFFIDFFNNCLGIKWHYKINSVLLNFITALP